MKNNINIQRTIIVSYIYNNIEPLESKYFDYAYKKLIAEYNKRLKINKELNNTLLDEYFLLDNFDINLLNITPAMHLIAKKLYKRHKTICISNFCIGYDNKIGLKLNRNIAIFYEKVVLNTFIYLEVKKPFKLNIELFTGIRREIANLINKLIDKNLLHRAIEIIDNWALKLDKAMQNEVLELYTIETIKDISFYYNKLNLRY